MIYQFDRSTHIHSLDGKPLIGTSTAVGIISKELTWWASGMACAEFGWMHPKKNSKADCEQAAFEMFETIKKMPFEEYRKLLTKAYSAHRESKDKAADTGTDMHEELSLFIQCEINGTPMTTFSEKVEPFVRWSRENVKRFLFTEMHCYSERLWVGGITDFGYVDNQDLNVLGDFKSSREAYFSQWAQCGGYDIQIAENGGFTADGRQVLPPTDFAYHAIFAAGAGLNKPFFNRNIDRTKKAFAYAANLYREKNWFEEQA